MARRPSTSRSKASRLAGFDRPAKARSYHLLRCALLGEGVDCSASHGWVSIVHSDEDIARTIQACERAFQAMAADRAFGGSRGPGASPRSRR